MCFNTSHVTLYLPAAGRSLIWSAFQYISCYSLSELESNSGKFKSMFQYISCYSLSNSNSLFYRNPVRFNTSHVTLYLKGYKFLSLYNSCFNTSHVTLYRFLPDLSKCPSSRFNTSHVTLYHNADLDVFRLVKFQYISCYSLSNGN